MIRLHDRLREIRVDVYGDDGIARLAEALGVPAGTWANYENGVTMPGLTLLKFIDLTGASPYWLLTGSGHPYTRTARAAL